LQAFRKPTSEINFPVTCQVLKQEEKS
jgi:hypothetical protein